jgi:DNA-binding response OmpR family regulator
MQAKIAIVEDEISIAQMYQFKFEQAGHQVKLAYNGSAGLTLIKEFAPDLILLDIKMPHMNGDEMLEKMRAQEWGQDIRVVILTNISRDEAPQVLRFLNVDRYIVKAHHTPQQVLDIVHEILK